MILCFLSGVALISTVLSHKLAPKGGLCDMALGTMILGTMTLGAMILGSMIL